MTSATQLAMFLNVHVREMHASQAACTFFKSVERILLTLLAIKDIKDQQIDCWQRPTCCTPISKMKRSVWQIIIVLRSNTFLFPSFECCVHIETSYI